jgi:hypothetical protein
MAASSVAGTGKTSDQRQESQSMCTACLQEYVGDTDLAEPTPEQIAAAGLTNWIYEQDWGGVGGPLHCEIEDHNLEDQWFEKDEIERQAWHADLSNLDWDNCNRLYVLLKGMTVVQRAQTMMLAEDARGR